VHTGASSAIDFEFGVILLRAAVLLAHLLAAAEPDFTLGGRLVF